MNLLLKFFLYCFSFCFLAPIQWIHAEQKSLLHLTFHKGCARDIEYVAEQIGFTLTTMRILDLPPHEFDPKSEGNALYNITHERAERIWEKHKEYFDQFDIILVSDTAPLARIFLQNNWKKPLIIWICNRFDYTDTASLDGKFPDEEYYQLLRDAIKKKSVHIAGYTPFEHYYARIKGIYLGTKVIKPCAKIELPKKFQSAIPDSIEREKTFFIPPYLNDTKFINLQAMCEKLEIPCYNGRYNGPQDLSGFKGIVHIPYSWSTLAFFEMLQLGIPYFIPSHKFLLRLIISKTPEASFFHPQAHLFFSPDVHTFSEFYCPEHAPLITYFDSWEDLKEKIETTDFDLLSEKIRAYAAVHTATMLNRWKTLFETTDIQDDTRSIATERLNEYKNYLEEGTYQGQNWSSFLVLPKSRYETFKYVFCSIEKRKKKSVIVELGTSRSFVHGGLVGCNSNDTSYWTPYRPERWDWGAGFFTRMAAESLAHVEPEFHTVDLIAEHIARCKVITKEFAHFITYHVASSLDFLQECDFQHGIDLLYLDTGDMTPIEPTALLQLEEAKIVVARNLVKEGGLILIDDVRNQTPKQFGETSDLGKSKYSLPYLLENGFTLIADEYQVILQKDVLSPCKNTLSS